jgi:hypothetical protein
MAPNRTSTTAHPCFPENTTTARQRTKPVDFRLTHRDVPARVAHGRTWFSLCMTAPSILLKSNPPPPDGLHTISAIIFLAFFASERMAWLAPCIGVSTTAGRVTLDGTVDSEEQIARAITLALETDGVVQITADLKVKSPQ